MALSQSTLASGLEALEPETVEAVAIQRFVDAWEGYFEGATVQGFPVQSGALSAALASLQGGLTGWSAPNAAAAAIQTGLTAFWATLAPTVATVWLPLPNVVTPPAVPPPGLAGVAASLTGLFVSLTAAGTTTKEQAAAQIAAVLHPAAGVGGTVIIQPPLPAPPIPGVPIL